MGEVRDVAVVGAGFGGALIARILASQGLDVVLIEQGDHPRFAVGESSTPLGNLCLERLAARYGLDDLGDLARHGRWIRSLPKLRRGLKRGFTFYRHVPGSPFANSEDNDQRLLVAASPNDFVADTQWLRADVDEYFTRRARAQGVEYRPHTEVVAAVERDATVGLSLRSRDDPFALPAELSAHFVIDASGRAGAVARRLGAEEVGSRTLTKSGFVGSHFEDVPLFCDVAAGAGAALPAGPYADDWSAVHHVLEEGWLYSLRFDDQRVSTGLLIESGDPALDIDCEAVWTRVIQRYPSIAACFDGARRVERWLHTSRIQHRLSFVHGARWACLPNTFAFVDPWFSTGIAWTLLGIERLASLIVDLRGTEGGAPLGPQLERYGTLLEAEATQIDRLVAGAYLARRDFHLTAAQAMLYFAAVSWAESVQRLKPSPEDAWQGFLGVDDPILGPLPERALARLDAIAVESDGLGPSESIADFEHWVRAAVASRNVAGLADSRKRNLYPVDLDDLVRGADMLGLTKEEVEVSLPRLRGFESTATGR